MSTKVVSQKTQAWTFGGSTATLRLYASEPFRASDGTFIKGGKIGSHNTAIVNTTCSVAGGNITIPAVTLYVTDNSVDRPDVLYTAVLYDSSDVERQILLANFAVPSSISNPTTWDALLAYGQAGAVIDGTADIVDSVELAAALTPYQLALVSGTNLKTVNSNSLLGSGDLAIAGGVETFVSDLTELSSLITAATSNPTLRYNAILDTTTTVSSAKTIPSNVFFESKNGSKFVKSNTGTLTFQGQGIVDDPQHQIFSGFSSADVTWTGNYPEVFRPEWWGAVADDNGTTGTDNLAAFDAMIAAMNSGYPRGGIIQLVTGGGYYLSNTWHVRRSVVVKGGANNTAVPNCYLRFPANCRGVVTHGLSTYAGVATTFNSDGSIFDGVNLNGAKGADNTIMSTNGLAVTLTGGTYTQTGGIGNQSGPGLGSIPAFPDGATFTLNGFTYIADIPQGDNTTKSTFNIQKPRFMVAYNSGTGKLEPIFGTFPSNSDWVGSTFKLKLPGGADYNGTTYTITAHNNSQITFSGGTISAIGAIEIELSGLKVMTGQSARLNIYPGFDIRSYKISLRNLRVNGFAGDGFMFNTNQLPSAYFGSEPDANNCFLELAHADFNAGHGFFFSGVNSNNISTHLLDADNNGGYGVYESASLGQNHFGFHLHVQLSRCVSKWSARWPKNMVVACYTEGSQPCGIASG
jgi:hypothetical protein